MTRAPTLLFTGFWFRRAASSFQVTGQPSLQAPLCAPGTLRPQVQFGWDQEVGMFGCRLSHSTSPHLGDREELLSLSG